MKTVIVVLAVLATASASVVSYPGIVEERLFEKQLNNSFNQLIAPLRRHDPVFKDAVEYDIHVSSGRLEDLIVAGFAHQYLSHIKIDLNILKPKFEITYELPHFEAAVRHYLLEGVVPGDGEVSLHITSIKLELAINVNLLSPTKSSIKFKHNLDGVFKLTGLLYNEELSEKITKEINKLLAWL